MKTKRLVSLLLAVLLIVGMIPTNAFAAISQGTDGDQNRVEISMTVSKNFGMEPDKSEGAEEGALKAINFDYSIDGEDFSLPVSTIAEYATALSNDNLPGIKAPKPGRTTQRKDFGEIPKNAMAYFSKVYTSTETSLTDAEVGGLIYLGLKTKMTNPGGDLKGLKSVTYKIRYDSTMFGPAIGPGETDNDYVGKSGDSTQSLTAKKGKFQKTMTINGIGPFTNDDSKYGSKDAADDFDEYAADYIIDPDITSLSQIDDSTYEMTINTQATNIHIPDNAPWDVVVALKVKKAGTSTISIVEKNDSTNVYTSALAAKEESGTALGKDNPVTISTFKSTDSIKANDVTVTAISNSPTLSLASDQAKTIGTSGDQTVELTLKNDTFTSGATTATNWSATGADVKSVTYTNNADGKGGTATVILNNVQAGAVTIKALAAALTSNTAAGLTVSGITAKAAPGTMAYDTDGGVKVTPAAGATGLKYKLGDNASKELPNTNKIPESELNTAAGTGSSVKVTLLYADDDPITTEFTAERRADLNTTAGTAAVDGGIVFDYEGEKVFAQNLMLKVGDAAEAKGDANGVDISTGLNSGVKITAYAPGNSSGIRSKTATFSSLKRPTHGALTAGDTKKTEGKTIVTGVANGDKYLIQAASATAPTAVSALTSTVSGTSLEANLTTDQKIHVATPGSNTAKKFASTIVSATGVGNNYGTITVSGAAKDSKKITLSIVGDTFVSTAGTGITIKKDGTAITPSWAANNGAWEATVDALDVGSYTIEATADAVTGSNAPKFAGDKATYAFEVKAEAGYKLVSTTATLSGTTTVAAGGTCDFTVTSPVGQQIKTITVSKGSVAAKTGGAAGEYTYTAPTDKPTGDTDEEITVTVTFEDIPYDALTYGTEVIEVPTDNSAFEIPATKDARITDLELKSVDPADENSAISVAADGKITVDGTKLPANDTVYTITVRSHSVTRYEGTAKIKRGKESAIITVEPKDYDGTNAVPADKIKVKNKGGDTLKITIEGATYDNVNVGTNKVISFTGATISGEDTKGYTPNTSGITGVITQRSVAAGDVTAEATKVEVTDKTDIQAIIDAIKETAIKVTGVEGAQGTVGDAASDTDIQTAIDTALADAIVPDQAKIDAKVVSVDASEGGTPGTPTQYEGGKITLTGIPADAKDVQVTTGNATLKDGVLTGLTTETVTITVTKADDTTYTVDIPVTAETDPTTYDFTQVIGDKEITVTLTTGDIMANTNATAVTVTLPITKKSGGSSGGNPYLPDAGHTVTIENTGYGSVDTTSIVTDEEGKIVSLPTVTNVKKGVSFVGWSTNGQISGVIDPNTFRVQNDELTLTAVYQGYMAGYEDSTARPNKQITRAELLKMLIVATGDYDATKNYGSSTFTDVKNAWYVNYIACAQQSGKDIIAGYGDGTFKPNAPVTRNEAARMICQAFGVKISDTDTTDKVNDFDKVAGWAQKYVAALCNNGTIHGYEDGEFKGDRAVTRGESSVMINGYLGLTKEAKEQLRNDPALKNIFKDMTDKQAWNFIDVLFAAMCAPASYYSDEITMPQA